MQSQYIEMKFQTGRLRITGRAENSYLGVLEARQGRVRERKRGKGKRRKGKEGKGRLASWMSRKQLFRMLEARQGSDGKEGKAC